MKHKEMFWKNLWISFVPFSLSSAVVALALQYAVYNELNFQGAGIPYQGCPNNVNN